MARRRNVPEISSEAFVARLHAVIQDFARRTNVASAFVEIEFEDGARFVVDAISPEPGFGFVSLQLHRREDDDPEQLVVPIHRVRRIELDRAEEQRAPFGFTLPTS